MPDELSRRKLLKFTAAAAGAIVVWPRGSEPPRTLNKPATSATLTDATEPTVQQSTPGNIFVSPEAPSFSVASSDAELTWRVTDYWGAEVATGATPGTGQLVLPSAVSREGFYTLDLAPAGQAGGSVTTTFAVVSPFPLKSVTGSAFGVNTHFGQTWPTGLIDLVAKAGVKNVRDEIRWQDVEAVKGTYSFPAFLTDYMAQLQSSDIDPLIIFDYTNTNYDGGATPYDEAGRTGFANYGAAVLEELGSQIAWTEVDNEFNLPATGDQGGGPANALPSYYFSLLQATYERVKAVQPDVTVIGAVTDGVPLDWLRQLFELGGLDYLDAVSVHLYFLPDVPEQAAATLSQLVALIRHYSGGKPKPFWITEEGFPTFVGPTGVDQLTQATYVVRSAIVALSQGAEKFFWYDFMNDGTAATQADNQGFVRNTADADGTWTPKPSYAAYAAMTRQLTGLTYAGSDSITDVNSYRFSAPAGDVRVVWAEQSRTLAIRTGRPVTVTDLMGVSEEYSPGPGGEVALTVSPDPIYVAGEELQVAATDRFGLAPQGPGVAFPNEPVTLDLTVDNTVAPRTAIEGRFLIGATSVPVAVGPGERARRSVVLPAFPTTGPRKLVGSLVVGGGRVARLGTWVDVVDPVTFEASHASSGGVDVLRVVISNRSTAPRAVGQLSWQVGDLTGTIAVNQTIAGGGSSSLDVSLSGLSTPGTYPVQLTLTVASLPDVVVPGSVVLVDAASIQPLPERTIAINGQLDDLTGLPSLDLSTAGTLAHADGYTGYGGPSDLSGSVWIAWDPGHLYLAAQIIDNVQYQPYVGPQLWLGDSIQVAVSPGLPDENPDSFDVFTFALTPGGPALHYTHSTTTGPSLGTLSDVPVAITRDDASGETIYKAAIPWGAIQSFDPTNELLSLSLVVNDNDGNGRVNWITWGGGMVHGDSAEIDPTSYHPAILTPS